MSRRERRYPAYPSRTRIRTFTSSGPPRVIHPAARGRASASRPSAGPSRGRARAQARVLRFEHLGGMCRRRGRRGERLRSSRPRPLAQPHRLPERRRRCRTATAHRRGARGTRRSTDAPRVTMRPRRRMAQRAAIRHRRAAAPATRRAAPRAGPRPAIHAAKVLEAEYARLRRGSTPRWPGAGRDADARPRAAG